MMFPKQVYSHPAGSACKPAHDINMAKSGEAMRHTSILRSLSGVKETLTVLPERSASSKSKLSSCIMLLAGMNPTKPVERTSGSERSLPPTALVFSTPGFKGSCAGRSRELRLRAGPETRSVKARAFSIEDRRRAGLPARARLLSEDSRLLIEVTDGRREDLGG
jgi:hypothetical protein